MPDPAIAAQKYREAVEAGDAQALRGLMTREGQQAYSDAEVRALLEAERSELLDRARSVTGEGARVEGTAVIRLGQRTAELSLEGNEFRPQGTVVLPFRSEAPEQVLTNLAEALTARDLSLLLSLLTLEQRLKFEERLDALLEGLRERQGAVIRVRGDRAEVELPNGQRLTLRREDASWQIEEVP